MKTNISNILELSTAHLRPKTRELLTEEGVNAFDILDAVAIYPKYARHEIIGWFMYPTDNPSSGDFSCYGDTYDDIKNAMLLAEKHNCSMVCFDVDEDVTDELPIYNKE